MRARRTSRVDSSSLPVGSVAGGLIGLCSLLIAAPGLACTDAGEASRSAGSADTEAPDSAGTPRPTASFDSLFRGEARLVLDEPDSAHITEIADFDVGPEGRLAIPAPSAGEVRVFSPEGRLLGILGSKGEGPGEFQRPVGVAFAEDGGVWVSDAEGPRVTRFSADLTLDTVFPLQGAHFGSRIEDLPDGVVVFAMRTGAGPEGDRDVFDIYTDEGRRVASVHPLRRAIRETPGWIAAARSRLAVAGSEVFTADNLLYPVYRWTAAGEPADSISSAPESWEQASKPDAERFRGSGQWKEFARWRRTFTTIAGLEVYRDRLLLVAHEALDPDVLEYEKPSYRLDVYRLHGEGIEKIHSDVDLPGRLIHAGEYAYFLLANPSEASGWTVARYSLRPDATGVAGRDAAQERGMKDGRG